MLATLLLLDFITREALFNHSLPHLKAIEQNRNSNLNALFASISEMSDKYAYVVVIALSYQFFDNESAFVITTTIYSALGALSLLKSMLHEARPFFVEDIKPTKCWFEYGNPSGHALTSSSLYLTIWDISNRQFNLSSF